jgi:RNA polymerase sigma-70 factor (ECF subfamily)
MHSQMEKLANEEELIASAKQDEQAFTVLYDYYFPKIYAYVFRRLGCHDDAEDVVSEVFLKVFSNLGKYQNRGFSFGAWLYRIATNCLIDRGRRQKHFAVTVESEELDRNPAPGAEADGVARKTFDRLAIEKVFLTLPVRYKEVICLRYFADLEIHEIAVNMNISENNASVLLHRALEAFKKKSSDSGVKFFCFLF